MYKTVIERLQYCKIYNRWIPKMLANTPQKNTVNGCSINLLVIVLHTRWSVSQPHHNQWRNLNLVRECGKQTTVHIVGWILDHKNQINFLLSSWQLCFGTEKVLCLLTSCLKKPQSHMMLKYGIAFWYLELPYFMTMHGHTLLTTAASSLQKFKYKGLQHVPGTAITLVVLVSVPEHSFSITAFKE